MPVGDLNLGPILFVRFTCQLAKVAPVLSLPCTSQQGASLCLRMQMPVYAHSVVSLNGNSHLQFTTNELFITHLLLAFHALLSIGVRQRTVLF
jgi:hypothetical protein